MAQTSLRSRSWVFTLNNPTEGEILGLQGLPVRYLIYGNEVSPTTNTPHLQGYLETINKTSRKQLSKMIPRAYTEQRKGTQEEAIAYCKKDGLVHEHGVPAMSQTTKGECGKRTYEDAFQLAKEGRIDEIEEPLRTRFYNTYKNIRKDYQLVPPPNDSLDLHWFYGPTGTGKSTTAREENPGYYVKGTNKWWDGYVDQPCVIIEEWNPTVPEVLSQQLKEWCDHHAFSAQTKGGMICIRPPKIIITSNYSMEECFSQRLLEPLRRRFKQTHFTDLFTKQ